MSKTRPCALCTRRPRAANLSNPDLCPACYDYAGWENEHSDRGHDDEDPNAERPHDCPICNNVPPPWTITEEPEMKNAKTRTIVNPTTSHMSHASCSHPRTPKGRAACRKLIKAGAGNASTLVVELPHVRLGKSNTVHAPGFCPTVKRHDGAIERTSDALTCKVCIPAKANAHLV